MFSVPNYYLYLYINISIHILCSVNGPARRIIYEEYNDRMGENAEEFLPLSDSS